MFKFMRMQAKDGSAVPQDSMPAGTSSSSTAKPPSSSSMAASAANTDRKRVALLRRSSSMVEARPICKFGVNCYRRNPEHLKAEAHPWDDDYLDCCREAHVEPQFISLRRLFEWADSDRTGKVSKSDFEKVWPVIQKLGSSVSPWDPNIWEQLDDDGNGWINFSEFVDACQKYNLGLPLGLEELVGDAGASEGALRCCVCGCTCQEFRPQRRRCKYGESCYQKNPEHRATFAHLEDDDWKDCKEVSDPNMCRCGHKKKLHSCSFVGSSAIQPPEYWATKWKGASPGEIAIEFQELVHIEEPEIISRFQDLFEATYSDVTTRDRANHNSGDWRVPREFTVISAVRNENSKLWRKYTIRKAEQQKERQLVDERPVVLAAGEDLPPFIEYRDVLTTSVWEQTGADELDRRINEWYLWHGTSAAAAQTICENDFKMRFAGKATGTLYGRGSYFAESITKADEYSRGEDGCYTVLLCRVIGGRVRYTDERTPDAEQLTRDCVEGPFDVILGDRKKVSGTYREFIVFDTEDVYPEYIITYRRGELFKSPSHP